MVVSVWECDIPKVIKLLETSDVRDIFCPIRPQLVNIEAADIDEDDGQDKDNEVIEDQLVHLVTKSFLETFCTHHRIFLLF